MPKLRPLPQRKVIEILRSNGFEDVRSSKHTTFKKSVDGSSREIAAFQAAKTLETLN